MEAPSDGRSSYADLPPGSYAFRLNIPVSQRSGDRIVNIPVDVVIMRKDGARYQLPLLVEAKSAGDYTNTNNDARKRLRS